MVEVDVGSIWGERNPEERRGWVWVANKDEKNSDMTAAWV